jgi:hypothetical protein
VNGFIGLTSALVDNLAESTGSTSEAVLALLNDQGIKLQLIQITLDQATPEQRERIDELIAAGDREGAWAYLDKIAKRRPKED